MSVRDLGLFVRGLSNLERFCVDSPLNKPLGTKTIASVFRVRINSVLLPPLGAAWNETGVLEPGDKFGSIESDNLL